MMTSTRRTREEIDRALIHRFGQFELDEARRRLRGAAGEIALQPRVFDLLVMLVRNCARVVSKDELLDALGPGEAGREGSLQRAVSVARATLGDSTHTPIRTFTGYGYRFCEEVRNARAIDGAPGAAPHPTDAPAPQIQYAATDDGVHIAYWMLGEGPPLVYVPNLIWSHGQLEWRYSDIRRCYRRLAAGRTLISFDPRGTGCSQRDLKRYSLAAIQRDLDAIVDRLRLERFALIGDLDSGPVAMRYAADHPQRVRHLILWHTFAARTEIEGPKMRMLEALQPLMDDDWETYTETRAHMGFGWTDGASAHRYAALLRQCTSAKLARASYEAGRLDDVTPLLHRITAPTLVLRRRDFYFWRVQVFARPGGSATLVSSSSTAPGWRRGRRRRDRSDRPIHRRALVATVLSQPRHAAARSRASCRRCTWQYFASGELRFAVNSERNTRTTCSRRVSPPICAR